MTTRLHALFASLMAIIPIAALGYDVGTHERITIAAIQASRLPAFASAIGLQTMDSQLPVSLTAFQKGPGFLYSPYCLERGERRYVRAFEMITIGVFCEDATFTTSEEPWFRYTYHFYDPAHGGHGLTIDDNIKWSSLFWAVEATRANGQQYSYNEWKGYISRALINPDVELRRAGVVNALRALGQITHLIEDLGQPQHTRNDIHGVPPSAYERFTDGMRDNLPYAGYSVDDTIIRDVRQFWHTDLGEGLADFSNSQFVSAGTNFRGADDLVFPATNYLLPSGIDATRNIVHILAPSVAKLCRGLALPPAVHGFISLIDTPVVDGRTRSSYRNAASSTYSVFDADLIKRNKLPKFTLNRFNFCTAQEFLIPRAVGYATAFLNFATRGTLDVALPNDGVYSVESLSPENCVGSCGFKRVKLKIKSSTLSGEEMGPGDIVVIARYHVNSCYAADLSGQPPAPAFNGFTCRAPAGTLPLDEQISVSNIVPLSSVSREKWSEVGVEFESSPIPFAATDLYFQVLWNGQLGSEFGAIGIGAVDVREPTFLTFTNNYDYVNIYEDDGKFLRTDPFAVANAPGRLSLVELSLRRFNESVQQPTLMSLPRLDPGMYARIAILTDAPSFSYEIDYRYPDMLREDAFRQAFEIGTARFQLVEPNNWQYVPDYITLRRSSTDRWIYQPSTDGATIYWHQPGFCAHPGCVPEDSTVDEQIRRFPPVAVTTPQAVHVDFNDRF